MSDKIDRTHSFLFRKTAVVYGLGPPTLSKLPNRMPRVLAVKTTRMMRKILTQLVLVDMKIVYEEVATATGINLKASAAVDSSTLTTSMRIRRRCRRDSSWSDSCRREPLQEIVHGLEYAHRGSGLHEGRFYCPAVLLSGTGGELKDRAKIPTAEKREKSFDDSAPSAPRRKLLEALE